MYYNISIDIRIRNYNLLGYIVLFHQVVSQRKIAFKLIITPYSQSCHKEICNKNTFYRIIVNFILSRRTQK